MQSFPYVFIFPIIVLLFAFAVAAFAQPEAPSGIVIRDPAQVGLFKNVYCV
jgi:hypothetical protein